MSAFSASSALPRLGLAVALALALAGGAGAAGAASRHPAAAGDSDRVLESFVIDKDGVRIQTAPRRRGGREVDIRIDPRLEGSHVRISADGDSGDRERTLDVNGPAIVVNTDGAGLVRVFTDAEVAAGERIEGDVVAVFGSVDVKGSVSGNVVAVFGSVKIAPGASVEGDVVAVGGVLDQAPGATVGGESVSLGFLPVSVGMPALPALLLLVFLGWLASLFVGWFMSVVMPERMLRVAATASRRGVASFFLGLVSPPLVMVTCLLLLITVIGIPIAPVLGFLYLVMVWAGQIAATYVLGSRLLRRRLGQGGAMMPILTGTLFVAMFFVAGALLAAPPGFARTAALFFSLLGALLVFCLTAIGTGAFLLSRFGTRPHEVRLERATGPSAAPEVPAGVSLPPATTGA